MKDRLERKQDRSDSRAASGALGSDGRRVRSGDPDARVGRRSVTRPPMSGLSSGYALHLECGRAGGELLADAGGPGQSPGALFLLGSEPPEYGGGPAGSGGAADNWICPI